VRTRLPATPREPAGKGLRQMRHGSLGTGKHGKN
jgi:hypothetical protein